MGKLSQHKYAASEHEVSREEIARRVRDIAGRVTEPDADERMIVCYFSNPDVSRQMIDGLKSLMLAILALVKGNLGAGKRYRRLGVIVALDDGDPGPPADRKVRMDA